MAISTLGRAGISLYMATCAGLVRPILSQPFNLAGSFLMTDLAILQNILMFFVVEGNTGVFGRQCY